MKVLRIDAGAAGLVLHGSQAAPDEALARLAGGTGPLIVMVHGYKFDPRIGEHSPHRHIFSDMADHACWKALSWPRALAAAASARDHSARDPLRAPSGCDAVAFGWPARGTLRQAHDRALEAGAALARLVAAMRAAAPHRPVHAIAHSMGARVVLEALRHLPAGALGRAVLLTAADRAGHAAAALDSPAGRTAEVLHVTSRENLVYDLALGLAVPGAGRADPVLGRAALDRPNLLTLRLDDPAQLAALGRAGFDIAPRSRRVCHWSAYLRPGVFGLYAAFLGTDPLPFERLAEALPPAPHPVPARRDPAAPRPRTARVPLPRGLITLLSLPRPGLNRAGNPAS